MTAETQRPPFIGCEIEIETYYIHRLPPAHEPPANGPAQGEVLTRWVSGVVTGVYDDRLIVRVLGETRVIQRVGGERYRFPRDD